MIFMGSQIAQQIGEFSEQFQLAREEFLERWEESDVPRWLGAAAQVTDQPTGLGQQALSTAQTAITKTFWALGGVLFVAVTGFYFALQAGIYRAGFLKLVPVHARRRVDAVVDKVAVTLWWWTLGRLAGMLVIGVGSTLGLWLLNIPLPVTQGVLAGLLNFVPNLGPLVASIPPLLLALQQGPNTVWYVAGFYLALQFVESYFLTPLIDQHQVHLPPGLVLSAQLVMGAVAGVLGLLLATPVAVVLYVLIREFYIKDTLGDHTALQTGQKVSGPAAKATT
jgi:predicted PurR-regulated permease PerM